MGARPSNAVKEIETIRNELDEKLVELERRLPPMVKAGKRALIGIAGGGGGGLALFAIKRLRSRSKSKRKATSLSAEPVVVQVLPKGMVPLVALGVAAWAGVRIYETMKQSATPASSGVVRPLREDGSRAAV